MLAAETSTDLFYHTMDVSAPNADEVCIQWAHLVCMRGIIECMSPICSRWRLKGTSDSWVVFYVAMGSISHQSRWISQAYTSRIPVSIVHHMDGHCVHSVRLMSFSFHFDGPSFPFPSDGSRCFFSPLSREKQKRKHKRKDKRKR